MSEFLHVDHWLDMPPKDDAEKYAKEFLEHCRRPAVDKDHVWIASHPLFATYEGKRWRVVGASRLGDVWLSRELRRLSSYDMRVEVERCSEWSAYACTSDRCHSPDAPRSCPNCGPATTGGQSK